MIETPLTDEAYEHTIVGHHVRIEFARKLEIELTKSNARIAILEAAVSDPATKALCDICEQQGQRIAAMEKLLREAVDFEPLIHPFEYHKSWRKRVLEAFPELGTK